MEGLFSGEWTTGLKVVGTYNKPVIDEPESRERNCLLWVLVCTPKTGIRVPNFYFSLLFSTEFVESLEFVSAREHPGWARLVCHWRRVGMLGFVSRGALFWNVHACACAGGWVSMWCLQVGGGSACSPDVGVGWAATPRGGERGPRPGRTSQSP